ncbi:hypothetical protein U1Q18_051628 [Sarracenia purpurea var. burkii]
MSICCDPRVPRRFLLVPGGLSVVLAAGGADVDHAAGRVSVWVADDAAGVVLESDAVLPGHGAAQHQEQHHVDVPADPRGAVRHHAAARRHPGLLLRAGQQGVPVGGDQRAAPQPHRLGDDAGHRGRRHLLQLRIWLFVLTPSGTAGRIGNITGQYIYTVTQTLAQLVGVVLQLVQTFVKSPTNAPPISLIQGPWNQAARAAGCIVGTLSSPLSVCTSIKTRMQDIAEKPLNVLFMPLDISYYVLFQGNISNFKSFLRNIWQKINFPRWAIRRAQPRFSADAGRPGRLRVADQHRPGQASQEGRQRVPRRVHHAPVQRHLLVPDDSGGRTRSCKSFASALLDLSTSCSRRSGTFSCCCCRRRRQRHPRPDQPVRSIRTVIRSVSSICHKTPFCRRDTPGLASPSSCYHKLDDCMCELFGVCSDGTQQSSSRKRSAADDDDSVDSIPPESPQYRALAERLSQHLKKQKRSDGTAATETMYQYWTAVTNGTDDSSLCSAYFDQYRGLRLAAADDARRAHRLRRLRAQAAPGHRRLGGIRALSAAAALDVVARRHAGRPTAGDFRLRFRTCA